MEKFWRREFESHRLRRGRTPRTGSQVRAVYIVPKLQLNLVHVKNCQLRSYGAIGTSAGASRVTAKDHDTSRRHLSPYGTRGFLL